jgi:cytochrome c oxidase subunit II
MMSRFLPPSASAHAAEIDLVITLVHALMLVLFVGWSLYFTWVLLRFRRGRNPQASHTGARGRIALGVEVGVVVAEGVLLVGFALPIWFAHTSAEPSATALPVRVVAEQFVWNVHYPGSDSQFGTTAPSLVTPTNPLGLDRSSAGGTDDIVVQNQLHLPIGRPVYIQLTSKDVIHSFGVPAMRVKQDAVPGLVTPVTFTPTATGTFDIACSQLCGLAHFRMRAILTVESDDAFSRFMAEEAAALQ